MTEYEIEELPEAICCPEVLGRLLERFAPMVRAICAARLGCSQCDDVQQEAFLRVIKNCDRLRDARHLPSYLRTITKNLCSDRIRQKRGARWSQVDPDLFDVFIREKVYLRYAERFLDPAQIDEIDLANIPGYDVDPAAVAG